MRVIPTLLGSGPKAHGSSSLFSPVRPSSKTKQNSSQLNLTLAMNVAAGAAPWCQASALTSALLCPSAEPRSPVNPQPQNTGIISDARMTTSEWKVLDETEF